MRIGGTLRYRSNDYFITLHETKNKIVWYLVSPYHKEDIPTRLSGEPPKHRVLDRGFFASKASVPLDYVIEAVERTKVSGKVAFSGGRFVLNAVLDALSMANAYSFSDESIVENENFTSMGIVSKNFSARDNNLELRYAKRDGYYTSLHLVQDNIDLRMDSMFEVKISRGLTFVEAKGSEKSKFQVVTLNTLDYESLRRIINLDWYEKDGVLLKDYRAITNIKDFEEQVIDEMVRELEECKRKGEEFILGLDTETTGLVIADLSPENEDRDHVVAIPIGWRDNQSVVVFTDMEYFKNVPEDYVISRLRSFIENNKGHVRIEKRGNFRPVSKRMELFGTVNEDEEEVTFEDDYQGEPVGYYEFNREDINLVGHNVMFDGKVFLSCGVSTYWNNDTLQMAFDLHPKVAKGSNKLKNLTHRIFGHETPELEDILGKGNEDKYRYIKDIRVAIIYACADTDYSRLLYKYLRSLMTDAMYKQYQKQDMRLINRLYHSEYRGLNTDKELLFAKADVAERDLEVLKEFMFKFVGAQVDLRNKIDHLRKQFEVGMITESQLAAGIKNINVDEEARYQFDISGNELREVLYTILRYPIKAMTQGKDPKPSVDKNVMKKLQSYKWPTPKNLLQKSVYSTDPMNDNLPDEEKYVLIDKDKFNSLKYPLAYVLSKFGELNKEWTSYYKPIKEQNLEGKIFKGYSLARIETRRIMNPAQTMKGDLKAIIKAYSDDYYLCDFDQSQVEYRIMASISKFERIIKKMNDPEKDYHTETAADVHGVEAHKVSKKLRKDTKGISFGVPYGLGDRKMCGNLFTEVNDETLFRTRIMLDDYKKANAPIMEMLQKYRSEPLTPKEYSPEFRRFIGVDEDVPLGQVTGLMGFYRIFDLSNMDKKRQGEIERPAGNFPIQNFAAELFRIILMRFYDRCVYEGIDDKIIWHMLIHDELLFSVHKTIHPFFLYKILRESCVVTIEGHTTYYIGINIGDNWAECKKDSSEAPMHFVDRMIARWDAGEFEGDTSYMSDVKGYVAKYRQEYIKERVGEVITEIQPSAKTGIIDLPFILDNFKNYTVRSYISDYFKPNQFMTKKEYKDMDDKDPEKMYLLKFESWVIDHFGEGKEMKYPDGTIRKVMINSSEVIDIEIDMTPLDEEPVLEEYWSFDSEEMADYQGFVYTSSDIDDWDEQDEYFSKFDTSRSEAKTVAELVISKAPTYNHLKLVNKQLIIKVDRSVRIPKIKEYLKQFEDPKGNQVVFETPIDRDRWVKIDASLDLRKLDDALEGILNAVRSR